MKNPYRCDAERLAPVTIRDISGHEEDRLLAFFCRLESGHTDPHLDATDTSW